MVVKTLLPMRRQQITDSLDAFRQILSELINPKSANLPAETLKLQVTPMVVVLTAAASGAVK